MKIYELKNNYDDFSHFIEMRDYFVNDTWEWNSPVLNKIYRHEMGRSNKNLKNFKLDVSRKINYLILSDRAKPLFEEYRTFFNIETDSKKKNFNGFFPNKCVIDSSFIDLRTSDYEVLEDGNLHLKNVFFLKNIENIDFELFVIEGQNSTIYITDKMKEKLERENLGGFSFNLIAYDSNKPDYSEWKLNVIKDGIKEHKWSDVIRKVYNFNGSVDGFEKIVENKFLVEEQPFLELYEQYKDFLYIQDSEYPLITKYEALCAKNEKLLDKVNQLRLFFSFLREKDIFIKSKYSMLCPKVDFFADGAMVGGRFIKGLKQDENI